MKIQINKNIIVHTKSSHQEFKYLVLLNNVTFEIEFGRFL